MLFNRQRLLLHNFGQHFMGRGKKHFCTQGQCFSLDKLPEGAEAIITCNNNLKTIERGLYLGVSISMFRNDIREPNLIVAVGDARYVLDRRIAREISIRTS